MQKSLLLVILLSFGLANIIQAQNVFPASENVGIGTNSPVYKLTISGSSTVLGVDNQSVFAVKNSRGSYGPFLWPRWSDNIMYLNYGSGGFNIRNNSSVTAMFMTNAGSVGIGTATPQRALQVINSSAGFDGSNIIYLTNDNNSYGRTNLILTGRLTNANDTWRFGSGARNSIVFNVNAAAIGANVGDIGTEYYSIQLEGNSKLLGFLSSQNGASPNMVLLQNGNIGIGTTSPQSKLAVNGTITATQVKVTQTGWPDFVFDSAYYLPALSKTAAFIKTNHHLPDIPSAKEIKSNGLDLGSMEQKQMQKIEGLTLYQIKADKRINQLENELNENQSELSALKKEIEQLKNNSK